MNDTSYKQEDGVVILHASTKSDSVVSPIIGKARASAALLYQRVKEDSVLQAKMSQRLLSTYGAPALMTIKSETCQMRACFKHTDLYARAVVSITTDITSDGCNGVGADGDSAWLQLCRKGHIFAICHSLDGVHWKMHRTLHMEAEEELKVGLVAQSPLGCGGDFISEKVSLKPE